MAGAEAFINNEIESFEDFTATGIPVGTLQAHNHPGYLFTSYFGGEEGFWEKFGALTSAQQIETAQSLAGGGFALPGGAAEMAAIANDPDLFYNQASGLVVKDNIVISAIPSVTLIDQVATYLATNTFANALVFGSYALNSAEQVINLVGTGYSSLTGLGDTDKFVLGFAEASIRKAWILDPSDSLSEEQQLAQIKDIIEGAKAKAAVDPEFDGFAEDESAEFTFIKPNNSVVNYTYQLGTSSDDYYVVNDEYNIIDGGDGTDIISYSNLTEGVDVDLGAGQTHLMSQGGSGSPKDIYDHIENVRGTSFADEILGDSADNELYGASGNDILDGSAGNDVLYGDSGDDDLTGGIGDDGLYGGSGNDTLDGGAGNNTLNGGNGTDKVSYAGLDEGITVDLNTGDARLASQPSVVKDTLSNIENVTGTAYDDTITGNTGSTSNVLEGGAGNEYMEGGAGADIFLFGAGSGVDEINDFEQGIDQVHITDSIFANTTAALNAVSYANGDATVDLGSGNSILIIGISPDAMTTSNFIVS